MPTSSTPVSVSVVIPTRKRPAQVQAAVRSALSQTAAPLEVIVVVDGPDAPTEEALLEIANIGIVRVLVLDAPRGAAHARNVGVRAARGEWVAFLDDDDLWLPGKLETQLAFAAKLPPERIPVMSCAVVARSPKADAVWPKRRYVWPEPVAEYLFCRSGLGYGEALLQTSTLMAPRALLEVVPFAEDLKKHQDWDWALRIAVVPGVTISSAGTMPQAIFHIEGDRESVGRSVDWRFSAEWALKRRMLFTSRALRVFLATECAAQAQKAPVRERLSLLKMIFAEGNLEFRTIGYALMFMFISQGMRRSMRDAMRRFQRSIGMAQPLYASCTDCGPGERTTQAMQLAARRGILQ